MPKHCIKPTFQIDRFEKPYETPTQSQFFAPKSYRNNKIYVTDWHVYCLSEPKDRDPFKEKKSLFLSTYDHLGNNPCEKPMQSETNRMLQQIEMKSQYEIEPITSMFNILSYFMSETPKKKEYLKKTDIVQLTKDYGKGDYETENNSAFINYFPTISKKKEEKEPEINFFKYHNSLSELVDAGSPKRHGCNKFLDDNLQDFYRFSRCRKR